MVDYSQWNDLYLSSDIEDDKSIKTTTFNISSHPSEDIPNSSSVALVHSYSRQYFASSLSVNQHWTNCVYRIQKQASEFQYSFAYLSTLGGAHFLVSQDRHGEASIQSTQRALIIAIKQEMLGKSLGSTSLIIRARVYQAVNWALLGSRKRSKRIFKECKKHAKQETWTNTLNFCESSEDWVNINVYGASLSLDSPSNISDSSLTISY